MQEEKKKKRFVKPPLACVSLEHRGEKASPGIMQVLMQRDVMKKGLDPRHKGMRGRPGS
jgi:hypothetical protein